MSRPKGTLDIGADDSLIELETMIKHKCGLLNKAEPLKENGQHKRLGWTAAYQWLPFMWGTTMKEWLARPQ